MLKSICVQNLAVVEKSSVDFGPGLNVITGETGAGKSIIIGALSLLLGDRADKTLVRTGKDQCTVEAQFHLADASGIDRILENIAVPVCEEGVLTVRRTISASGAGKSLVNDSPVTLQTLKAIGELLVDMHGPHDHQSLLSSSFQTDILDSHGHLWNLRSVYEEKYRQMLELKQALAAIDADDSTVSDQIDLLSYQVKEISDAALQDSEDSSVENELALASNAATVSALASSIQSALTESEESAFNAVASAMNNLTTLARLLPDAEDWLKEANSASIIIQELSASVAGRAQAIETDNERIQWLDDRLAVIRKLKSKYGGSIDSVRKHLEKAGQKLEDLQGRGEKIAALTAQIKTAENSMIRAAADLTGERKKAAVKLSKSITGELQSLGFKHGSFSAALYAAEPGPSGCDLVDFGFAPNAGEEMRPLKAIASSGEISRVMLAVKAVLARHDRIPVLIFDEIDANVGGEMGNAIGKRLAAIAGTHQVICITHLPQVAAYGKHHFQVIKEVKAGRTITTISEVSETSRVNEIARMLGGKDITSVVTEHARELLDISKPQK